MNNAIEQLSPAQWRALEKLSLTVSGKAYPRHIRVQCRVLMGLVKRGLVDTDTNHPTQVHFGSVVTITKAGREALKCRDLRFRSAQESAVVINTPKAVRFPRKLRLRPGLSRLGSITVLEPDGDG